ncbi:MAG: EVE domain-containing protein [Alphaproteobacteria bacterium]|nr:MAG: EVE domain-containing protein [Alphaproteobacteria bacterium]
MAYWLMKSEPFKYSWDDLVRDKTTQWDGVRNYAARNNLQAMVKGDKALLYHSNEGKACVAIMEIVKTAEPDKTVDKDELSKDGSNPWVVVTVAPVKALQKPVTLEMVKNMPELAEMELMKYQRLSVQKVREQEWKLVLAMAGM